MASVVVRGLLFMLSVVFVKCFGGGGRVGECWICFPTGCLLCASICDVG